MRLGWAEYVMVVEWGGGGGGWEKGAEYCYYGDGCGMHDLSIVAPGRWV